MSRVRTGARRLPPPESTLPAVLPRPRKKRRRHEILSGPGQRGHQHQSGPFHPSGGTGGSRGHSHRRYHSRPGLCGAGYGGYVAGQLHRHPPAAGEDRRGARPDCRGGLCGHGKGLYLWGKDGRPVRRGILSSDNRAWRYPLGLAGGRDGAGGLCPDVPAWYWPASR